VAAYRRPAPLWQPRTPKSLRLPAISSSSPPFSPRPHLDLVHFTRAMAECRNEIPMDPTVRLEETDRRLLR
jgi:hypothetical protein